MKNRFIYFIGSLLIIVVMIISVIIYNNKNILNLDSLSFVRPVIILFFPPSNLYKPIYDEYINKNSTHHEAKILNIYKGKHNIGIFLDNFKDNLYFDNKQIPLEASVTCKMNDEIIFSNVTGQGKAFIGHESSGYELFLYSVPNDMPINENVICVLSFDNIDKEFIEKYGPVRVFFKKISDL